MFSKTLILQLITQNGGQIADDNPDSKKVTNTKTSNELQTFLNFVMYSPLSEKVVPLCNTCKAL